MIRCCLICVISLLGTTALPISTDADAVIQQDQCNVPNANKVDCGYVGSTKQTCEASGCCWQPASTQAGDTPWCFYKSGSAPSCPLKSSPKLPFSAADINLVREHFKANLDIDGKGGVVAAPDHNTGPGGDYYFAWERDGALSMYAYQTTFAGVEDIHEKMQHYVGWVGRVQSEADPNGIDVKEEPKYVLPDGAVFTSPWCRPQNDGPALRARTLMLYANNLTDSGYVSKYLWTADGKGAIPTDLDFVATIWNAQTCDLWEEIRSDDLFWNRMMQRAAMHQGTAFAKKMGDSARAAKYAQVAQQIDSSIMQHFNGNFVYEDQSRQKDSAVIEAFNKGYLNDGVFGPLSVEVAKTVQTLNTLFCTSYKINQNDTQAGVPGILYGRYEGDTYDGGNPWVLLSASLAELLYRAAADLLSGAKPTDDAFALWNDISGEESSNRDAKVLGTALLGAGDGVMTRIRHHIGDQMHMNEQIDRNTGALTSAKDLTWNYANILSAMLARSRVSELL